MTFFGKCLLTYIGIICLAGFLLCGIDKGRAKLRLWRVPERTLFLISFLGGGAGLYLGMQLFRHKTRHLSFRVLVPLSAALWAAALIFLQLKWSLIWI